MFMEAIIKKLITCLCLILIPTSLYANPSISGVSGTFTSGNTITISGSDFGYNVLIYQWISPQIEATATGSSPSISGWDFTSRDNVTVTSSGCRSGSKCAYDAVSWNGGIAYTGSNIGENTPVFVSWWVKHDTDNIGQWKMFRLNWQNDIVDDYPQIVMFNWFDGVADKAIYVRPGSDYSSSSTEFYCNFNQTDNIWVRYDLTLNTGNIDGGNGTLKFDLFTPGASFTTLANSSSVPMYKSSIGSRRWRSFIWQNYYGNNKTYLTIWMDDFFIQVGTVARVELGNASTWSTCTSRDIQPGILWGTTSIQAILNPGNMTGTAYVYVVKSDGTYNETGYPITLGGSGEPTPTPTPTPIPEPSMTNCSGNYSFQ